MNRKSVSLQQVYLVCFVVITFSNSLTESLVAEVRTDLGPINGTLNYRIYGKKGKDDKPWVDGPGLDMRHIKCLRRGRCD